MQAHNKLIFKRRKKVTRPSANLDKKMLNTGIQILIEEGDEGLTLRNICKKAHVNPGMFSYCFKTKENYITLLYGSLQEDFKKYLDIEKVDGKSSIEKLKYVITKAGEYILDNQKVALAIFRDSINDYDEYKRKVEKGLFTNHDYIIFLIKEAKDDGFIPQHISITQIFIILSFGIITPVFFADKIQEASSELCEDRKSKEDFLKERIDIIFNSITKTK